MLFQNCFITNNQPSSNEFRPTSSILPDRFNSTSMPVGYPIVGEEFSSISQPASVEKPGKEDRPGEAVQ